MHSTGTRSCRGSHRLRRRTTRERRPPSTRRRTSFRCSHEPSVLGSRCASRHEDQSVSVTRRRPVPAYSRRGVLAGLGAACTAGALDGCTFPLRNPQPEAPPPPAPVQLAHINASPDRITAITVCTRPFRRRARDSRSNGSPKKRSCTTTAMAAAAGRCPGARARSPYRRRLQRESAALESSAAAHWDDLRAACAKVGPARHDLREGCPPMCARRWRAGLDAGLQNLLAGLRVTRIQAAMAIDGARVVQDVPDITRIARYSGRVHRQLLGIRRLRYRASSTDDRRYASAFAELQRELIPDLIPQPKIFPPGSIRSVHATCAVTRR